MENENWQKGLRHQLTVNRSFTKAKKCKGAGWYWKLSEYILLLKDVKRIVDDAKMVENTTEGEEESETITGDIQSVLEPDEAFVVVKEETIESKLLSFVLKLSINRPFGKTFENLYNKISSLHTFTNSKFRKFLNK